MRSLLTANVGFSVAYVLPERGEIDNWYVCPKSGLNFRVLVETPTVQYPRALSVHWALYYLLLLLSLPLLCYNLFHSDTVTTNRKENMYVTLGALRIYGSDQKKRKQGQKKPAS